MLRAILCATIVAAFPLTAGAAGLISEDIPIPGGTEALVRAAGIRVVPDRSRFVAEITRLLVESPIRDRQNPVSAAGRLSAHLLAAARFQRALTAAQLDGVVSLADARNGTTRRRLSELFDVIGLRLRDTRGTYSVEPTGNSEAMERARLLGNLGIDIGALAAALNRGEAVTMAMPVDTVPVPLSSTVWSDEILGRRVPPTELFAAILADERATLLCHGLAGLDDLTLQYVAEHPDVLRGLYIQSAAFAAFGNHLKIRNGRVLTPGEALGDPVRIIWEDLAEARTADPARFIASVFEKRTGRLAYLYDTIGELDPPRAAFALNLWMKDPAVRIARMRALVTAVAAAYPEWPTNERPFVRPLHDLGSLFNTISVNADGSPKPPSARRLWERAFESQDLPDDPARLLRDADREGPIDAAWLAENVAMVDVRSRGQRLMQLAFGYRVFDVTGPAEAEGVLVALRAFVGYRTVALGVEQMGLRTPAVYVAAARRAEALTRLDDRRAFVAMGQFQGALAILVRLAASGDLTPSRIEALVTSLSTIPLTPDGRMAGGTVEWLRQQVLQGEADSRAEDTLLAALAGPATRVTPFVDWEGGRYRFDPATAEIDRLRRVRRRQDGYPLDAAVQLYSTARSLSVASIDLDGIKRNSAALERLQRLLPRKAPVSPSDFVPGGAEGLEDPREVVDRGLRELGRISRPQDARRAGEIASDLVEAADVVLAEVLSSIAYALSIGDPDGATLLGGDVARRHDFGVGSRVPGVRGERPWSIPEQHFDPGVPWHVSGSLIGLDAALAPLALRRLAGDAFFGPPVLGSNDRETFARSVALLNPYALNDAERDTIGLAIARGRQRVALARTDADIDVLADSVRMDGWRRRALRWALANEPERTLTLLSLTELFMLGGGDIGGLHAWGPAMTPLWGCLCTRMPPPNAWRFLTGRPQVGVLGSSVPDLTLHVAASLHDLDLPAGLARSVLSTAMQQFVDTVQPNDGNDWLALVRGGREVSRERLEDLIAAAAAVGGPLVPIAAPAR